MTMSRILMNTAYFPPVEYVARVAEHETVVVEVWESYGKQSYRNRCEIMTANGPLALSVPVRHGHRGERLLTRDARVDYSTRWQKLHWKAVESAYKHSAFFDYYADYFVPFFERRTEFLVDLNEGILRAVMEAMGMERAMERTRDYEAVYTDGVDARETIHPKPGRRRGGGDRGDGGDGQGGVGGYTARPYHQTFADRFAFVPNLSVLDLIFNVGPEAAEWLRGE